MEIYEGKYYLRNNGVFNKIKWNKFVRDVKVIIAHNDAFKMKNGKLHYDVRLSRNQISTCTSAGYDDNKVFTLDIAREDDIELMEKDEYNKWRYYTEEAGLILYEVLAIFKYHFQKEVEIATFDNDPIHIKRAFIRLKKYMNLDPERIRTSKEQIKEDIEILKYY